MDPRAPASSTAVHQPFPWAFAAGKMLKTNPSHQVWPEAQLGTPTTTRDPWPEQRLKLSSQAPPAAVVKYLTKLTKQSWAWKPVLPTPESTALNPSLAPKMPPCGLRVPTGHAHHHTALLSSQAPLYSLCPGHTGPPAAPQILDTVPPQHLCMGECPTWNSPLTDPSPPLTSQARLCSQALLLSCGALRPSLLYLSLGLSPHIWCVCVCV